jgi:hypothetical protein
MRLAGLLHLGLPAYMSPEQMRSAKLVDVRTDVWRSASFCISS